MSRTEIFRSQNGVAIEMVQRVFDVPPVTGKPLLLQLFSSANTSAANFASFLACDRARIMVAFKPVSGIKQLPDLQ